MKYSLVLRAPAELYDVLKPEQAKNARFTLDISKEKNTIISITASDATALKAITTSMIKLIEIAEKIRNE
ncbi:MAG TPA: KEOPS complex subunit Pcc1 [Candidatus Nanoarchaeia archaeon]|nr:KEOPS complex subunit Pcc1 [Candidatus Nanoarchaeia archaeon]